MQPFYNLLVSLLIPVLLLNPFFSPASSVSVTRNEAETEFPYEITFFVRADSTSEIEKVTLIYGTSGQSCFSNTVRREVEFTPMNSVNLEWTWDLSRSGGLPPGAVVAWQWEIQNKDGEVITTDPQEITLLDRRFEWQKLKQSPITLQWVGSSSFGRLLLQKATTSLERLTEDFGIDAPDEILIMIYPTNEDLLSATLHVPDWTGGVAIADYNTVMTAIAPDQVSWADEVIPHELAHLVVDRRIYNCQGNTLPTWLSEGLATYAEGPIDPKDEDTILDALEKDRLPALNSLMAGFAANPDLADQAYAYSGIVLRYMIETFGSEKLDDFLGLVQEGRSMEAALKEVYSLDTNGIDQAVRASLGFDAPIADTTETPNPVTENTAIPTLALWSPFTEVPTMTPTPVDTPTAVVETDPAPTETTGASAVPPEAASTDLPKIASLAVLVCGIGGVGAIALIAAAVVILTRNSKKKTDSHG